MSNKITKQTLAEEDQEEAKQDLAGVGDTICAIPEDAEEEIDYSHLIQVRIYI